MGHKIYGEEPKCSRLGEFIEWFFAAFMTFTYCIGGWLVHFGMSLMIMFIIAILVALAFALLLTRRDKKQRK